MATKHDMNSRRLFKFALLVRLFVILLQIIFNLVPDHDADAFRLPHETDSGSSNTFVSKSLSGFSRWDAQYFLHVALYGYTHENTLAFFPLFPITLRFFTSCLSYFLSSVLSEFSCALIAGVFLNSFLSSLASVYLYKLTFIVFHSEIFAYTSALLFCINPASIFFSALYSEALFSLVTFSGLWTLESGNYWVSLNLLALSAAVRSNGVLLLGFFIYAILKQHVTNQYQIILYSSTAKLILYVKTVLKMVLSMILFMIPFILYQVYCYVLFCTSILPEPDIPEIVVDYVTRNDLKIPSEPTKWCFQNIPLAYTYVQTRYWDVGFLRYYTYKQIPNFILASPIALLVFMSSIKYFYKNRRNVWHGGLLTYQYDNISDLYSCSRCFPYFLFTLAVAIFCTLFIHVQVMTRILCSCSPVIYWIAAAALLPNDDRMKFKLMKEHIHNTWLADFSCFLKKLFFKAGLCGKLIFSYFISYFLIGIFLHVNFLPWT